MKRQPSSKIKKRPGEIVLFAIVFLIFVIYAVMLFYPLIWGLLSSFKSVKDYNNSPFSFPSVWHFENYIEAIKTISDDGMSFTQMLWNSVWFAVGSAIIHMEFTSAYAYVLNKYNFRGRKFLYGLCLFMMAVPIGASFVSTYRLMHNLHLTNSYLILLTSINVYGMKLILCYSYYNNISNAYVEAAQIDGANFYTIYFKAMRPQATPILLTLMVLEFIEKWNDYMGPLLYLSKMPTLATGLYRYQSIVEWSGNYPVLFAGIFICTLPLFIIFIFFSNKLMDNISVGGLKG
ncbi:carbohydrate ABC transporter permease [bacterium]|nr:carbohydrate ABC transporter permease [bacterium]MDD6801327.1 carbohydrate ABC transporter permease [Mollicutes bacterium]MDY2687759.1 carbohydrate ABC transporter permease [Candidatus Enteromonas sp.]